MLINVLGTLVIAGVLFTLALVVASVYFEVTRRHDDSK